LGEPPRRRRLCRHHRHDGRLAWRRDHACDHGRCGEPAGAAGASEKDDWTPAEQCQALAQRAQEAGLPVSLKIYPGAYHAFDSAFPVRYIAERRNVNKEDGRGATTGGNAAAWQDRILQVKSFFGRYLRGAAKD
jgi:dienelactone hydrolase